MTNGTRHWFIDAVNGSDRNPGDQEERALASWSELTDRLGHRPRFRQDTVIHLLSDLDEYIDLHAMLIGSDTKLRILGRLMEPLTSGTLSGVTDLNALENQTQEVEDSAMDWAGLPPEGLVKQRIRLTSGANQGATAWIARANPGGKGAHVARTSPFVLANEDLSEHAVIKPAAGNAYAVDRLPKARGIRLIVDSDYSPIYSRNFAQVRDIDVDPHHFQTPEPYGESEAILQSSSLLRGLAFVGGRCKALTQMTGGSWYLSSCLEGAGAGGLRPIYPFVKSIRGHVTGLDACLSYGLVCGSGYHGLFRDTLIQGERLAILPGTGITMIRSFAVCDSRREGISIFPGASLITTFDARFVWGHGNAGVGVDVRPGAVFEYTNIAPLIEGVRGTARIGGILKTRPQLPFFNLENGAGVVRMSSGPTRRSVLHEELEGIGAVSEEEQEFLDLADLM